MTLGDALLVPGLSQHYDWRGAVVSGPPLLLDTISVPALGAYSVFHKLRRAYAGSAFRLRRSSDNALLDVGFVGDVVDIAAALAHVGAGSGFIDRFYGQGLTAFDLSQATLAKQPRLINAGTLDVMSGSTPALNFDGVDDSLTRPDVMGLTLGSPGPIFTEGMVLASTAQAGAPSRWTYMGGSGGGQCNGFGYNANTLQTTLRWDFGGTEATRPMAEGQNPHTYTFTKAAGTTNNGAMWQDGAQLGAVFGASNSNFLSTASLIGSHVSNVWFAKMRFNFWCVFDSVLTGANLAALQTEMTAHL